MNSQKRSTHLVVFAFPAQGHVNAALDLSRALASADAMLSVTFVCTETYVSRTHAQGFSAGELQIRLVGLSDGLSSEQSSFDRIENAQGILVATQKMGKVFESLLDSLIEDARRDRSDGPACIIYDSSLWWVDEVSKKYSIPGYSFFPMSAIFLSFMAHFPDLVSQGRLPLRSESDVAATSNLFDLPGFPSLHASELPEIAWDPNPMCTLQTSLRYCSHFGDASGVLINTFYELEKEIIEGLRAKALDVRAVGPLLSPSFLHSDVSADSPEQLNAADQECLDWLDLQPTTSVLYVAFGTIGSLPTEQIHELAMGLEASEHRFLWVVRLLPDQGLDVDSVLPEGFEERMKGRGKVVRGWAPQRRVLRHRATGGFLTHCGWNSTLESVCMGIPLLCWPLIVDQFFNSKLLDEVLEVGKAVKKPGTPALLGRKEVSHSVRLLMDDKNPAKKLLRMKASLLKQSASAAMLPGGSSYNAIHSFLEGITPPTRR